MPTLTLSDTSSSPKTRTHQLSKRRGLGTTAPVLSNSSNAASSATIAQPLDNDSLLMWLFPGLAKHRAEKAQMKLAFAEVHEKLVQIEAKLNKTKLKDAELNSLVAGLTETNPGSTQNLDAPSRSKLKRVMQKFAI